MPNKPQNALALSAVTCFILFFPLVNARAQTRALTRTEDFVVLAGRELPGLEGAETKHLRLYSCARGSCRPVPVQVDKIDERGR
jgi:hypothetical protein